MRRFGLGQLDARDAERPDVGLEIIPHFVIGLAGDHLWRHPVGRANERAATLHAAHVLGRDAEVGQLDHAALGQQDVARFHVPMDDETVVVQVDERLEQLTHHILYLLFAERSI